MSTTILASYGGRTCVFGTIFRRLHLYRQERLRSFVGHFGASFRVYNLFKVNALQYPCVHRLVQQGTATLWTSSGAAASPNDAEHLRTLCVLCASFLSRRLVEYCRSVKPSQMQYFACGLITNGRLVHSEQNRKHRHELHCIAEHVKFTRTEHWTRDITRLDNDQGTPKQERRKIPLIRLTDSVKRTAIEEKYSVNHKVTTDHVPGRQETKEVNERTVDTGKALEPNRSVTESKQQCIVVHPLDQPDKPILVKCVESDKLELKHHSRPQRVSFDVFAKYLHFVVKEVSVSTKGKDRNKKQDSKKESDIADDFPFEDFYTSRIIRLTPAAREVIALCMETQLEMKSEMSRYSTFGSLNNVAAKWLSPFLSAGGWLHRLAEAGFYLAVQDKEITLRCAFCDTTVHDISKFNGKHPIEVHRELEPTCPFVTGKDTTNRPLNQFWQTSGNEFLQRMFKDAAQPSERYLPQDVNENHRSSRVNSEGASAQYQLPHPRQLGEQRLTTASASQTSARQPLSLPATVNMDCHQSGPLSLQHTPSSATSAGRSREQPAAHMALNQSSFSASLPISTAQVTPAQNAPPQTPLAQNAPSQTSVQMPMAQSARVEPQTSSSASQSHPSAHTAPPPAGNSTQVPPHQSQAPNQASTSPQNESSSSENPSSASNPPRQVVTYAQLGIYTQQPKRPDMVVQSTRCGTFTGWPHTRTHTPEEMAEAGFYYTGHIDLARCFYCKGGLKSWAGHLRPWVEHARFFPECPYVNQVKGRSYIEAVQALHTESEAVSEQQVEAEMARRNKTTHVQQNAETATECGATWGDEGGAVGGALGGASVPLGEASIVEDFLRNAEPEDITKRVEELENTIQEAKEERICKICQSNEVNILFLPCGHLVACAHCAPALRTCAVCRQSVKGRVRVYMNEEEP